MRARVHGLKLADVPQKLNATNQAQNPDLQLQIGLTPHNVLGKLVACVGRFLVIANKRTNLRGTQPMVLSANWGDDWRQTVCTVSEKCPEAMMTNCVASKFPDPKLVLDRLDNEQNKR